METVKEQIEIVRKKLQSGEASVGTWQQIPHLSISEILANGNFEWVALDMEHGMFTRDHAESLVSVIAKYNCIPLVRVCSHAQQDIQPFLDAGVGGIIIPRIETAQQLSQCIGMTKFPPEGTRGVAYSRSNQYGRELATQLSDAVPPLVVAQIESYKAFDRLHEIISVPGVDALMIGPYDLSASLGKPGQFQDESFKQYLKSFENQLATRPIALGYHVVDDDAELLVKKVQEGYQFIAYGVDTGFLWKYANNPILIQSK